MARITSEKDFELLWKLASINNALTLAVTDPVVVQEPGFPDMFYDCTEEEDRGLLIVQKRIEECSDDIHKHLGAHRAMLSVFYDFDESLNRNDRFAVCANAADLSQHLIRCADIVSNHISRSHDSFLNYLSADPTNMFTVPLIKESGGEIRYFDFNAQRSYGGIIYEMRDFRKRVVDFRAESGTLFSVPFGNHDTGKGINDTSYRGRLALTEELLRHAGYSD